MVIKAQLSYKEGLGGAGNVRFWLGTFPFQIKGGFIPKKGNIGPGHTTVRSKETVALSMGKYLDQDGDRRELARALTCGIGLCLSLRGEASPCTGELCAPYSWFPHIIKCPLLREAIPGHRV